MHRRAVIALLGGATISWPPSLSAQQVSKMARIGVFTSAADNAVMGAASQRQTELAEKQVELLTEAFPDRKRLAVLYDDISANQFDAAEQRAKLLGLEVCSLKMESPPYDFETAFRTVADVNSQMLLVLSSPFFARQSARVTELAIRYRLPSMFIFKAYTEGGGLMSYGADNVAMYRQSASYVAKILRGANPADLPIELPTKFELAVNLKTAKALGVELPTSILLRANDVIE